MTTASDRNRAAGSENIREYRDADGTSHWLDPTADTSVQERVNRGELTEVPASPAQDR